MARSVKRSKFSIFLNVVFLLFFILYFLFPFLTNGILTKIVSPFCGLQKTFQGPEYLPDWCDDDFQINLAETADVNENTNINKSDDDDDVEVANPAAVKCEEDGGTLEDYATPIGTATLCVFDDDSICNQWDYFREDCAEGECQRVCDKTGTSLEGWYNSCTDDLLKLEQCGEDEEAEDLVDADEPSEVVNEIIKLISPSEDEQLSSPFKVEGQVISPDNIAYIRVTSKSGTTLIEEDVTGTPTAGSEWADFDIELDYEFTRTTEGFVEVYTLDPNDQEIGLVSIPVKF